VPGCKQVEDLAQQQAVPIISAYERLMRGAKENSTDKIREYNGVYCAS